MSQSSSQPKLETVKDRVVALIQALLLDDDKLEKMIKGSKFQSHFKPVILSLVKQLPGMIEPMLKSVSDDDLKIGLEQVRDEYIPFLLDEPRPAALRDAQVLIEAGFVPHKQDENTPTN
jgi:hypothetical protein